MPSTGSTQETTSHEPGPIAQSAMHLTGDPGVSSLIPARSHTFVEIDHEIIYMDILLLIQEGLLQLQEKVCA